ncbi:MAG: TetR family transcriptional regulator [Acidobacteria bacterium]|nr:TetR family transcriptional regulator [Acidobacteriota bacterium]
MATRRTFVQTAAAASAAAAGGKVESLALNGGAKAVSFPADRHAALTKWPRYGAADKQAVIELMESNRYYQEIPLLEKDTQDFAGVPHCKAHCNGTSALMSMFFALDLPPGSEILVPSYTASATIVPMRFFGLVPVFTDIDPATACLDLNHAARVITPRSRAIVPMHSWGRPCDMDQISAFAKERGLIVLEDAAQAQGATLLGKQMGAWGAMGIFSYQTSKVLPAIEGGMGLYHSRTHYERATAFGNYDLPASFPADSPYRKYHDTGFGPKFRIHPLAAAIARRQLKELDARNALIREQTQRLNARLTALPGLSEQKRREDMSRVHWAANVLFFDAGKAGFAKDRLIKALAAEGVRASSAQYPEQHKFAIYREAQWWHHAPVVPEVLPGCARVNGTSIRLPLFAETAPELVEQYAAAFEKVWAHRKGLA